MFPHKPRILHRLISTSAGKGIANPDLVAPVTNLTAGVRNHWGYKMRWFKHYATASDNSFIEELEEKFGLEGYARWYKLLEIISREMDGSEKCSASHSVLKWQFFLKAKRKNLETFLVYLEEKRKISRKSTGNILEISAPILLNCRDDYSRKSGHAPNNVAVKNNKNNQIVYEGKCALQAGHEWHSGCTALPPPYWIGAGKAERRE